MLEKFSRVFIPEKFNFISVKISVDIEKINTRRVIKKSFRVGNLGLKITQKMRNIPKRYKKERSVCKLNPKLIDDSISPQLLP